MKQKKLPSGAVLEIGHVPFGEARALFQSVLEEAKTVKIDALVDHIALLKELFCVGFSSKKIELNLWQVLGRCMYDGAKIAESTFESDKAREDFVAVCLDVIQETIGPFMKGLSAGSERISQMIENTRK